MPPMTTTLFPYTTLFRSVRELFGFLQNPPFVLCTFMLQKFLLNPCPWRDTVINIEVEAHFVDCFEQCEDIVIQMERIFALKISLAQQGLRQFHVIDPELVDDVTLVLLAFVLFGALFVELIDGIGKLMRIFLRILAPRCNLLFKSLQPILRAAANRAILCCV